MARIISILLLISISCKPDSSPTEKSELNDSLKNNTIRDTVFLLNKQITDTYYHKVYESEDSLLYDHLIPIINDEIFYTGGNQDSIKNLNQNLNIKIPSDFPTNWTEVIYYNNKFYLKCPSDFCYLTRYTIFKSALVSFTCEGPWAFIIQSITKKGNQFELTYLNGTSNSTTIIQPINEEKDIYIWKSERQTILMADVSKMKNLLIAKSDCGKTKCPSELKSQNFDISY